MALAVESILLFAAVYFFRGGSNYGDYLATMACGMQNARASTYTGTIIRPTHVTGIVTDPGIAAGNFIRRERVEIRRVNVLLVLLPVSSSAAPSVRSATKLGGSIRS